VGLENISEDQEQLEVVYLKRKLFLYLFCIWSIALILFTIIIVVSEELVAFVGLFMPVLVYGLLAWGLYEVWSIRNDILITNSGMEIYVNKTLYLEIFWEEIESLVVFKEKWDKPFMRYQVINTTTGYSLRLKGPELDKTVRLWCYGFSLRNQKRILAFMKNLCKSKNKQLTVEEIPTGIIGKEETPCDHLAFRKRLTLEKKKKIPEKAVNGGDFW